MHLVQYSTISNDSFDKEKGTLQLFLEKPTTCYSKYKLCITPLQLNQTIQKKGDCSNGFIGCYSAAYTMETHDAVILPPATH